MTNASVDRPQRDAGTPPRIALRPSRFLQAALLGFIVVAGFAVFQCVHGHAGAFDAFAASAVCVATLGLTARRWARRQPAAVGLHAEGLTVWDRAGNARYWRIIGCAQWSGRLLALDVSTEEKRREALLIAADSLDADTFRQLSVSARRAASSFL
ncbi:hypothetical protein P9250_28270 [Caballeronia sp. LP006]|jgi:hypothetical protein|uniref:protein YgfX n=1 Tax=Caballeronia sp. LP006 TaxID=3038552 RepID=UPI0028563790|nr:protein YgfX [Caballeronia sp. LP006]MDR5831762.1 hypothetical protein [Caballeronia sp. LP006]